VVITIQKLPSNLIDTPSPSPPQATPPSDMADELEAMVQRILEEEEEDKQKRKNRMKKEKNRAAKDRKICDIYIQSLQFSIQQSVQED
jgi:guanylate kinase